MHIFPSIRTKTNENEANGHIVLRKNTKIKESK
jgi:hypothetical protein